MARYRGVKIGYNCDIQDVNFGSEPYLIEIGDNVQITNGTKIFTHGGGWVFRKNNPDFDCFGKVLIKNNVYIGNNALIMPGVTIGTNVIIGAGSVVTKSIDDNMIVAGNPAKIIGEVSDYYKKISEFDVGSKRMTAELKKKYLLGLDENQFIRK
jgi:acetyltransferase-like isoleucine patch superfamily enzyme